MDVKSTFLNGMLTEEVYVEQPIGFQDPHKLDHVFRLKKTLNGLKQAPQAWYERLTSFLLKHNYEQGNADKTLFIKCVNNKILCAQIYVDYIVLGSTSHSHALEFNSLMKNEFEVSMVRELNMFLGLQIKKMKNDMFVSQSKNARNMLKRFCLENAKHAKTLMSATLKLSKDEHGKKVDNKMYRSMIESLLYLFASRPDICFSVGVCIRFQTNLLSCT